MTNALNYMVNLKADKKIIEVFFNTESSFYSEENMHWLLNRYYAKIFKDYTVIAKRISDGKEIARI